MPAKLIIYCPGSPNTNGHKRRSFLWNPQHKCFVFENKVFDERDFNLVAPVVFKKNQDLRPCVRVVGFSDEVGATVTTTVQTTDPTPISQRPITVEQALEVVMALAPDRLKKMPGRKPALVPEEV